METSRKVTLRKVKWLYLDVKVSKAGKERAATALYRGSASHELSGHPATAARSAEAARAHGFEPSPAECAGVPGSRWRAAIRSCRSDLHDEAGHEPSARTARVARLCRTPGGERTKPPPGLSDAPRLGRV